MSAPHPLHQSGTLRRRVLAIGELRDAVLFLATATYVLGYLTWAIYSADRELGVLPPLEGQYFLAGVVPLVLVALTIAALGAITPRPTELDRKRASIWGWGIFAAGAVAMVGRSMLQRWIGLPETIAETVAVVAFYLTVAFKMRAGELTGYLAVPFRLGVPLLAVAAAVLYATRAFPYLPQELGGPKPSCVTLDVTAAAVSPSTLASLRVDSTASSATVRSAPLWLHFDGGGTLVLSQGLGRPIPMAFRLRDSTVSVRLPSGGCQE